jgi:hypothetical protein
MLLRGRLFLNSLLGVRFVPVLMAHVVSEWFIYALQFGI